MRIGLVAANAGLLALSLALLLPLASAYDHDTDAVDPDDHGDFVPRNQNPVVVIPPVVEEEVGDEEPTPFVPFFTFDINNIQGSPLAARQLSPTDLQGFPEGIGGIMGPGAPTVSGAAPEGTLSGVVQFQAHPDIMKHAEDTDQQVRFVLKDPDGKVLGTQLADDQGQITFDTTQTPNGRYSMEIHFEPTQASGNTTEGALQPQQAYDDPVYHTEILVMNARSTENQIVGAAAVGIGVVAVTSVVANNVWQRSAIHAGEGLKEAGIALGEDRLRNRGIAGILAGTSTAAASRTKGRVLFAFLGAVVLLAMFFALEAASAIQFSSFMEALPIVGAAALFFFTGQFVLEGLASRVSGMGATFRFLWSGAIALAASTLIFRTAFGYPGFVDETDDPAESGPAEDRMVGIRALGVLGAMLGLMMPFVYLGEAWRFDIMEEGLAVAIVAISTAAMPFAPLPGADVWKWNKLLSLGALAGAVVLFFAFNIAALAPSEYYLIGGIGAGCYVLMLMWLNLRRQADRPAWYTSAVAGYDRTTKALTPGFVTAIDQSVDAGLTKVGASIGGLFAKDKQGVALVDDSEE